MDKRVNDRDSKFTKTIAMATDQWADKTRGTRARLYFVRHGLLSHFVCSCTLV